MNDCLEYPGIDLFEESCRWSERTVRSWSSNCDEQQSSASGEMTEIQDGVKTRSKDLGKIAIVRLQVKSEVKGVIDGDITIPVMLDVNLTWNEVFRMLKIKFDPEKHLFRAYGKFIEDFAVPISELYSSYKTKRDTYFATIIPKPKPVIPPCKTSLRNRKRKSSNPAVVTNSQGHVQNSPKEQKTANSKASKASLNRDGNNASIESNNAAFKPPAGFILKPTQSTQKVGPEPPSVRRTFGLPPPLMFRDESTMAGDILLPEESEIKSKVLRYFERHCSNRDMISMRAELTGLKKAMKFQALNRLIPFTAGILQNAFLDEM